MTAFAAHICDHLLHAVQLILETSRPAIDPANERLSHRAGHTGQAEERRRYGKPSALPNHEWNQHTIHGAGAWSFHGTDRVVS